MILPGKFWIKIKINKNISWFNQYSPPFSRRIVFSIFYVIGNMLYLPIHKKVDTGSYMNYLIHT